MANKHQQFIKWHIWLGWLVGIPLILWTVSGLFMVARPIQEVRGEHLLAKEQTLAMAYEKIVLFADNGNAVTGGRLVQQGTRFVWIVNYEDGQIARYDAATGEAMPRIDKKVARETAESLYVPEETIHSVRYFAADDAPLDLRRQKASWQVRFADGTNIYIDAITGEKLAVRTRFWRAFDFMWGLHIMDPVEREDTSHPVLIFFAAFALIGSLLGFAMLFTRRRRRKSASQRVGGSA